jgi:hypothetical protein
MPFKDFDFGINACKSLHIKGFFKCLTAVAKYDTAKICCAPATVRQSRAGIDLARIHRVFKCDYRRFVKGTVPAYELNSCAAQRYNFFSPRPRVVFFHLFLRGSRAAFFLPIKNHFNSACKAERCIAKPARIKIAARL